MRTENRLYYYCGKTFPSSLQWIGYILIFITGLIIYYQKLESLSNPTLWIFLLYIFIVLFSRSYIEIIDNESGKFRKFMKLFFLKIGKAKNINDYKHGIFKITRPVYASPKGSTPWSNRDTEFALQVAKLWFTEKTTNNKELVYSGKKEEMQRFINDFVKPHELPLYLAHYKPGNMVN